MKTNRRRVLTLASGVLTAGFTGTAGSAHAATGGERSRILYAGSYGAGVTAAATGPAGLPTGLTPAADTPDPSYVTLSPDRRTLYTANELEAGIVSAFAVTPGGLRPLGARDSHGVHPCHVHVVPSGRFVLSAHYTSASVTVHRVLPGGALGDVTDVVHHEGSGPDPDRQLGPHTHNVRTDPTGRFVHAVDLGADAVFTYGLDGGGRLHRLHATHLRPGSGPRHIAFHPSGRLAYVACELDATVAVLGHDPATGRLTPLGTVAAAPAGEVRNYPSEVVVAPGGRTVYVANRGHNSIAVFTVDGQRLTGRRTVPCGGDWPRHMTLAPDSHLLYVANQRSGTIAMLRVHRRTGDLTSAGTPVTAPTPTAVAI